MLVGEALAGVLAHVGVRSIFGLAGLGNLRLVAEVQAAGIDYFEGRHENSVVAMADAYARVTGRLGICMLTEGPGLTNGLTALVEARKAHTPILVLAGDTPTTLRAHHQEIDQVAVARALGVRTARLRSPMTAAWDLAEAARLAWLDSDPILVPVPVDLQEAAGGRLDRTSLPGVVGRPALRPDDQALERVLDLLARSSRMLIVAGSGAARSGAGEALVALAERTGAVLATSAFGKGLFAGHPNAIGAIGTLAAGGPAEAVAARADLVLAFGTSLNQHTTWGGEFFPDARIVHVDLRESAIGALTPTALGIVGDARAVAVELLDGLDRRAVAPGRWAPAVVTAETGPPPAPVVEPPDGHVDPADVCRVLDGLLPAERTVVLDGGLSMAWPHREVSVPDPAGYVWPLAFMTLGIGVGLGIGARIGRPDRLPVLFSGDGAFAMNVGELDAAVHHRIPLLVVVLDNRAYGAEVHMSRVRGLTDQSSRFQDRDFAAIARAMGAAGTKVRSLSDLDAVRTWLQDPQGPMVLDCKIDVDRIDPWFARLFAPGSWLERWSAT